MAVGSLSSVLALVACIVVSFAQNTVKPNMTGVIPSWDMKNTISTHIGQHLPGQKSFDINYWDDDWIPSDCASYTKPEGYSAADFEAFNVTYNDCADPWIMCRHKNSTTSAHTMADMFGHIPLGMREYNRHMIAIPTFKAKKTAGGSANANILIKDDCWDYNILIHEISHSLDASALTHDLGNDKDFSTGHLWQDEYFKDEHSISDYGMTSWQEDLADSGVIAMYDLVVPGGIHQVQPNWTQIQHQYTTFQKNFADFIKPNSKCECTHRLNNSEPIATRKEAMAGRLGSPPDVSFRSNIKIIESATTSNHKCYLPISNNGD
ncbi:hypothetical protein HD806DRAFT_550857 [Xylariaceae sp. AK1471]|nr:hypothetical protein HD806DRAFT_550857 [Xylariaceae sp. AK1471]